MRSFICYADKAESAHVVFARQAIDVVSFGNFPAVWSNRDYRMIYLNIGHGDAGFSDATQNLLIINALRWIVSRAPGGDPFKVK